MSNSVFFDAQTCALIYASMIAHCLGYVNGNRDCAKKKKGDAGNDNDEVI